MWISFRLLNFQKAIDSKFSQKLHNPGKGLFSKLWFLTKDIQLLHLVRHYVQFKDQGLQAFALLLYSAQFLSPFHCFNIWMNLLHNCCKSGLISYLITSVQNILSLFHISFCFPSRFPSFRLPKLLWFFHLSSFLLFAEVFYERLVFCCSPIGPLFVFTLGSMLASEALNTVSFPHYLLT